jgi:hypothetical protein
LRYPAVGTDEDGLAVAPATEMATLFRASTV